MKKIFFLFLLSSTLSYAQKKHTISGYVQEKETGEYLIGVTIFDQQSKKGTATNQYGFYSLTLEEGNYEIVYSFLGKTAITEHINLQKDIKINQQLSNTTILTKEVEVVAEKTKNVESTKVSQIQVAVQQVKQLPALMGEVDILKSIQLLPGVQSGGEGSSGFYVRGGGPDQNLILLDEATVYNASHLFGFFSVFNADAIKDINLIKGGMPAQYGGRLASVLDISMKEGNNQKYGLEGGLGIISSRLTIEGPIIKNKASFIVSGRRTYADILAKPFLSEKAKENGYYFYDLTAKTNYRLSDKDRFFLSGYFGNDIVDFSAPSGNFSIDIPWGNETASARWNHLFNDKLFLNTTLVYSDYSFQLGANMGGGDQLFEFKLSSSITDWNTKLDFTYLPNLRNEIRFGSQYIYHTFLPASMTGSSGSVSLNPEDIFKQYANEAAIYLSDDFVFSDVLKFNFGGRYTAFQHSGHIAFKDMLSNEFDRDNKNQYHYFEPRFSLRYSLSGNSSLKGSYTQNYQYIHLVGLSSMSMPTDLWLPSSDILKPKYSEQYTFGYFKNLLNNAIETSAEIYYKNMENLAEYKEGAFPEDNPNGRQDILLTQGDGYSYGLELFVKKSLGKTTGWVGYTYSVTNYLFPEINHAKEFPAKYDRRHDFSLVATHDLNPKLSFSTVLVYATGSSLTIPVERYVIGSNIYTEFTSKNGYRMEPYHRMDISVNYTPKPEKRYHSSWNFSVYNVYNRKNPYFIYLDIEDITTDGSGSLSSGGLAPKAYKMSLFPIIPSITWNFKF